MSDVIIQQDAPQAVLPPPAAAVVKSPIAFGENGIKLQSFDDLQRFATAIFNSAFKPKGFESPADIMIAIQCGAEIGIGPARAVQSIAVINGRPGIYGDLALALCRSSGLLLGYSCKITGEGDTRVATVSVTRRPVVAGLEPEVTTRSFRVADAVQARLWKKAGPWTEYPERMLEFRARSWALRDGFGDVLCGMAIVEEMQDMKAPASSNIPSIASLTEGN